MAEGGYPEQYQKGAEIVGLKEAEAEGAVIFQAGTAFAKEKYVVNGGRVLGVTAAGTEISKAIKNVYKAVDEDKF